MRILHTNFHRGWGGQTTLIFNLCRGLMDAGHRVTIAAPRGSDLAGRGADVGIEVFTEAQFTRGFRPRKMWSDVSSLRKLIAERRFDLIHTHGSQDSWAIACARYFSREFPPVLRTKHNLLPIRDHYFNRKLYGAWTDAIVGCSAAVVDYCAAKPYLQRDRIHLIHNGIDCARFARRAERPLRDEFELADRYVAGVIGRLQPVKGHLDLIEALPAVLAEAPEFTLLIVGEGSEQYETELRSRIDELGISDRVLFAGFRSDVPEVLSSIDLFVMPSRSEGLGISVIEAAAASLPIVASRVGGIPEILTDGEEGLLVATGDRDALSSAILRFYHDRELASRCAEAARHRVQRNFSIETLVAKTEAVYRSLIDG